MNEEDAFLRAICADPDEDTPRLVFADWLQEQGGPVNAAWANGIRAQVWLAHGMTAEAATQRSLVFESAYGQAKVRERLGISPRVGAGGWERGFPVAVSNSLLELRDEWPRLAFRVPIQKLHVFEVSEASAAGFVTWPALTVLRELTLGVAWETPLPGDVLATVAGCAALSGLEVLIVTDALLTDVSVTAVLDSPHLTRLKTLRLRPVYETEPLAAGVANRLRARFGPDALV